MLGAIIGDIAGSIYEFDNIKTKKFDFFGDGCNYTDDTVMTVAVGKAILLSNGNNEVFEQELIKQMHDFGNRYPYAGYGGMFKRWIIREETEPYNSFGNGSAMRVSACGDVAKSLDEALELAEISAKVTHNHPEGIKGAKAVSALMFLAKNDATKKGMKDYIQNEFYSLDQTLDEIRPNYSFNETCQETVPQAIEAFLESTDFEDAIRNAISLGGDSDTLAAITGSIAEAYYGIPKDIKEKAYEYLPNEFIEVVEKIYSISNNK